MPAVLSRERPPPERGASVVREKPEPRLLSPTATVGMGINGLGR